MMPAISTKILHDAPVTVICNREWDIEQNNYTVL